MLKIRFARTGRQHIHTFRIVVTEHKAAANHGYQEVLGWYDPQAKKIDFDAAKAAAHLKNGAQLSPSLAAVLKRMKIEVKA
jgi:ribosomal protein S16